MKKIKVLLSALAMVAAMAFVSCGGGAGDDPTGGKSGSDPVKEGPRAWVAASADGVTITDNGDGTCTFTLSAQYNGSAVLLYINEDKSSIAASETVAVDLDYETTSTANPKFYFCLAKDTDDSWNTTPTSGDEYRDADAKSGNLKAEITATAESNEVKIKFNAWQWAGAEDDTVKITVKSVTVK